MLNTLVIRTSAACVLASGGVLYAMDTGLIGNDGAGLGNGEQTLSSESRAAQPHSLTPDLPIIATSSDVRLPMAAEPVAPEAMVVPATFDDAQDTPDALPETPAELSDLGLPCGITVTATAMPAAIVALDVMAPCRTSEAVSITHTGLTLEAETDALGLLTVDVPAFETPAFFTVIFADGVEETALVGLPDLSEFDRIGLSWQGNMGLELHAMEFGAAFGEDGHIWQDVPASAATAVAGEGGFLTEIEIGDSYAQIYTLPRATLREGESVRLSIDAPITADNCAASVVARTFRTEGAGPLDITELSFTVPGCDAIGDVLVLQNLLDDLRLASN